MRVLLASLCGAAVLLLGVAVGTTAGGLILCTAVVFCFHGGFNR